MNKHAIIFSYICLNLVLPSCNISAKDEPPANEEVDDKEEDTEKPIEFRTLKYDGWDYSDGTLRITVVSDESFHPLLIQSKEGTEKFKTDYPKFYENRYQYFDDVDFENHDVFICPLRAPIGLWGYEATSVTIYKSKLNVYFSYQQLDFEDSNAILSHMMIEVTNIDDSVTMAKLTDVPDSGWKLDYTAAIERY